MKVEKFLKSYSIFSPNLKFLPMNYIKGKDVISHLQYQTIRDGKLAKLKILVNN